MRGTDVALMRNNLDLDQFQLAHLIGTHVSTVYRWESAGPRKARMDHGVERILDATRVALGKATVRELTVFVPALKRALLTDPLVGLHLLLGFVTRDLQGRSRAR